MSSYPAHLESDVVLRDGSTVRIRPWASAKAVPRAGPRFAAR